MFVTNCPFWFSFFFPEKSFFLHLAIMDWFQLPPPPFCLWWITWEYVCRNQMAFCNKLGNLVKQSISQNGQVPVASLLNSIRCFSSSKLFIGGIYLYCLKTERCLWYSYHFLVFDSCYTCHIRSFIWNWRPLSKGCIFWFWWCDWRWVCILAAGIYDIISMPAESIFMFLKLVILKSLSPFHYINTLPSLGHRQLYQDFMMKLVYL